MAKSASAVLICTMLTQILCNNNNFYNILGAKQLNVHSIAISYYNTKPASLI